MKKAIILPFIFMGLGIFLTPTKANAGPDGSCVIVTGYYGGELNGNFYDMGEVFESKAFSDAEKLEIFKDACKRTPLACKGNSLKHQFVDAVCSDSFGIASGILEGTVGAGLDDKVTVIPRKSDDLSSGYEDFRVSLGGFVAYVGRKDILDYMMNKMPIKYKSDDDKLSRPTMGDKMYTLDKNNLVHIDKTLYDVALSGRKLDDRDNPSKPFITFIQAEKKKWDARQNFAAKMHDDLVKAAKGGKMAIDNYTGKNLALDGKTYNEINKLLKLNRS